MRNLTSGVCSGCGLFRDDLLKMGRAWIGYCAVCRKIKKRATQAMINRINNLRIKQEVFSHYGNKCAYCGDTVFDRLQIDHMNNDGDMHRLTLAGSGCGTTIYRWLKRNNYPDGFQLLCVWCNVQKRGKTHQEFTNIVKY